MKNTWRIGLTWLVKKNPVGAIERHANAKSVVRSCKCGNWSGDFFAKKPKTCEELVEFYPLLFIAKTLFLNLPNNNYYLLESCERCFL